MSLLPSFRAILDENLGDEECQKLLTDIKDMKGVLSATFNKGASGKSISVTHRGDARLQQKVAKMQGVKATRYQF
jgi:hypothetical protein